MEQNVRYYWILEQVNHLCPSHNIYGANLYIHYHNLLLNAENLGRKWTIH